MNDKEMNLDGVYDLAKLESIDTSKFRGKVRSLKTGGLSEIVMTPSPYFGAMPKVGEVVGVYTRPGWSSRYLGPVARLEPGTVSQKIISETKKGDVPTMSPGDVFIGPKARLFFDDTGNAVLRNFQGNLSIKINDHTSKIALSATNYSLSTPGDGIRIITRSSVPTTFGDTISIEKNAPLPTLPEELTGYVPSTLTSLSSMQIDALGGVSLSSVGGLAKLRLSAGTLLDPFVPGNIRLENPFSALYMDALGGVKISSTGAAASVSSSAIGTATSSASIFSTSPGLSEIDIESIGSTSSTTISAKGASAANVAITAAGGIPSVTIDATGGITASVVMSANLLAKLGISSLGLVIGGPTILMPATIPLIGVSTIMLIPICAVPGGPPIGHIPVIA